MSLQVQPLPQQQQSQQFQQPVQQVYPNPTTYTYESPPHHSNGSFGSVFVVLAIIIVISAVACCLGRLCGRKSHGQGSSQKHSKQQKQQKQKQNHHDFRPTKEVDIEFGFDKKIAASKPTNGHGHGHGYGHGGGGGRGPPKPLGPPHHGGGGGDMNMKSFEIKLGPPQKLRAGGP